jgi:hypothetical protein
MKERRTSDGDNGSAACKVASLMLGSMTQEQKVADRCICEAIEMGEGRECWEGMGREG